MELVVSRDDDSFYLTSAETGWPRVSQQVYEGVFIAFLPVIIIATITRLAVKLHHHRRLEIDDGFLVMALCCSVTSWGFAWVMRDLIYLQMELVLYMTEYTTETLESMASYLKWYNVSMVLTWTAIYAVKLSFMFFFRKLISRVRFLEVYWWIVMAFLIPIWLFSAFFSFWICPYLSIAWWTNCPIHNSMIHEETYVYTTTTLDIFTDLLIILLPIMLLAKVSISLKRKVFLGMALCLSIFMIIICIIRATTCKLPNGIIDSTWLSLWQCVETNTAILLVSLTAFRSLYRQGVSPNHATPMRLSLKRWLESFWPASLKRYKPMNSRSCESQGTYEQQESKVVQLGHGKFVEGQPHVQPSITGGIIQEDIENQLLPSLHFTTSTLVRENHSFIPIFRDFFSWTVNVNFMSNHTSP